ncbi:hypothetical protein BJX62DRAFT_217286 [Aspergillus germanicus]
MITVAIGFLLSAPANRPIASPPERRRVEEVAIRSSGREEQKLAHCKHPKHSLSRRMTL